jgi:hypothetical protein
MTTAIGYSLAGLIAAAIVFIGARFVVAPRVAAAGYGVPAEPDRPSAAAYRTVKGIRDIASGLFLFILLAAGATHLLGWVMLAAIVIPVADAAIVLGNGGTKTTALGIHGVTAAVMLVTAGLLLAA